MAEPDRTAGALRKLAVGAVAIAVLVALGFGVKALMGDHGKAKKPSLQTIAVLRPPPPPPPPKPEPKPPEPEMKKQEVKLPDPEPEVQPDEPPPAQDLGVDAQGGPGSDGFGLQGRPGGRDITTIGGEGQGSGRGRFGAFAAQVEAFLQEQLARDGRLRSADYRAVLELWFRADGRIERAELVGGTGNAELDTALRTALAGVPALRVPLPADLPQPIRLRLTSRGAG